MSLCSILLNDFCTVTSSNSYCSKQISCLVVQLLFRGLMAVRLLVYSCIAIVMLCVSVPGLCVSLKGYGAHNFIGMCYPTSEESSPEMGVLLVNE